MFPTTLPFETNSTSAIFSWSYSRSKWDIVNTKFDWLNSGYYFCKSLSFYAFCFRLDGRIKREVDLTPEEILALLSLYENNRQRQQESSNYRQPWNRYEPNFDIDINQDESQDQDEENWLDNPVFPHATGYDKELGPKYMIDQGNPQMYDKKVHWGGFGDNRKKRFMVRSKIFVISLKK